MTQTTGQTERARRIRLDADSRPARAGMAAYRDALGGRLSPKPLYIKSSDPPR
jgi:hypothetical protein